MISPARNTGNGSPARALAAIATIRRPGVARATATPRVPRRRSRSVAGSSRVGPDSNPGQQRQQDTSGGPAQQQELDAAADDPGNEDHHQAHHRIDLTMRRCNARTDDEQVARNRDRQADLLDQDQAGDREQPDWLHRLPR